MRFKSYALDHGYWFFILCEGIEEGTGGESLELQHRELRKGDLHKPSIFPYISSVI